MLHQGPLRLCTRAPSRLALQEGALPRDQQVQGQGRSGAWQGRHTRASPGAPGLEPFGIMCGTRPYAVYGRTGEGPRPWRSKPEGTGIPREFQLPRQAQGFTGERPGVKGGSAMAAGTLAPSSGTRQWWLED